MNLKIKEGSENYACTVIQIDNIHPIENSDNLVRTVIFGNNVVISKDIGIGNVMLYFVSGTRLSSDFCKYNNLYEDKTLNNDVTLKGYINNKCRVRAVKLRGVISDGLLLPLDSLDAFHLDIKKELKIGDTFTTIREYELCEKYVVPAARNSSPGGSASKPKVKLRDLMIPNQFRFHTDTAHFARNISKFNPTDNIVITRKYHGTSGISSRVLVKRNLSFIERVLLFFGVNISTEEYGYIYGTGKPKSQLPKGIFSSSNPDWKTPNLSYYNADVWLKAFTKLKDSLEKGITLYYEVVGEGIQGADYTYGFEHEIFVYRITYTNVDGQVLEFKWQQVKDYCNKYGIKYVDEYAVHRFEELPEQQLQWLSDMYLNKSLDDCKIDEGICIRNETTNEIFKLKSPKFLLGEDASLEKDESNLEDDN